MIYADLTAYVVKSDGIPTRPDTIIVAKADPKSKNAKAKPPAVPPEQYITINKREPNRADLEHLLEAAGKEGIRPGLMGGIIAHESDGTWSPHVRPAAAGPGKKPPKLTTTGIVRGDTGSSAVGIAQYIEPRWLMTTYLYGERIIANAGLDKTAPEKAQTIRTVKEEMDRHYTAKRIARPDWNDYVKMSKDYRMDPHFVALWQLRSDAKPLQDTSGSIPYHALAIDISDYQRQIVSSGYKADATAVYILHHSNFATLADLMRNPNSAPKASADAVKSNGAIFKKVNEDGEEERKTGRETLKTYQNIVSDYSVSAFELKYFGRDFSAAGPSKQPRVVRDAAGHEYKVRNDLIIQRIPVDQFIPLWRAQLDKPAPQITDPASMKQATDILTKMGESFGKNKPAPTDANDPRFRQLIKSFKEQVGLPFPDRGMDAMTLRMLQVTEKRVDFFTGLQQQQQQAIAAGTVDLKAIGRDVARLPATDPHRVEADNLIRGFKQQLADLGYMRPPPAGRTFDGRIDPRFMGALSDFQRAEGLIDTKGNMDALTMRRMRAKSDQVTQKVSLHEGAAGPADQFNGIAAQERISTAALGAAMQTVASAEPLTITAREVAPSVSRVQSSRSGPRYT